jgi:O-antigen ligase
VSWAVALWAAIFGGILVAWSPRYWAVAAALCAVSAVVVAWAVLARGIRIPPQVVLVAPIGGYGLLQIGLHISVLPHLTLENSLVWAVSAAAFLVSADVFRDSTARHIFLDLLMWSLTLLAVIAIPQHYLSPDKVFGIFPAGRGGFGTLLSENQFAAMMELGAPVALWHAVDRNPIAGGACFAMILAGAIAANSRAGVILIAAELLVFLIVILITRRYQARTVLAIAGGAILIAGVSATIAGTEGIRSHFEDKDPYAVRRELLKSTVELIRARPWVGYGLGTWRSVYPRAASFDMGAIANEAHNDWAQWTSDGGIPFGLLMAGLVVWIGLPALRSAWGIGVISVMAHSFVDYPIREPVLSLIWFVMAGSVSVSGRGRSGDKKITNDKVDRGTGSIR